MELKNFSDIKLIRKIKKDSDSDAYLELKRRVEKSYYKVCERYVKKVPALKYNELVEDCDFLINKSIQTYNPKKNTTFNTWVTNYSRYHILNTIKKLNELGHFVPTENLEIDLINNNSNKYHIDTKQELKDHIFNILSKYKDSRAKTIFEMRFFGDKFDRKWSTISQKLGLSVQQSVNILNSARQEIYKQMTKENSNK